MTPMERAAADLDCDRCQRAQALFFVHRTSGQSVRLCADCKRQVCDVVGQRDRPGRRIGHAA